MTDRREQILTRLREIAEAVPGIKTAVRNRGELPADKRPAITVMDGDEIARPAVRQQQGRLTLAPNLIDLSPEIYVLMDAREPHNEKIGEDMNALRVLILKAIITDAALAAILGSNGDILYDGCVTDMASGRAMQGSMNIQMTFTYALKPSEL